MRKEVVRYFERATDDFFDLVDDIIDRIDEDDFISDSYEAVWEAIDNGVIYYDDQWEILKHYCDPKNADWDYAIEEFANDIADIAQEVFC